MYRKIIASVALWSSYAMSHEMTPSYVEFGQSYMSNIKSAKVTIINRRSDAKYYGVYVLDRDMNKVPFASSAKVYKIPSGSTQNVEIYVREKDINRVAYVCSKSELIGSGSGVAMVSSKICSKVR